MDGDSGDPGLPGRRGFPGKQVCFELLLLIQNSAYVSSRLTKF